MPNRVVVTGYGAITPLGLNVEDTWQRLVAGVSGIDYITLFDATNFNVKIAGEVKNFSPTDYMDPTTARYTDRFAQFGVAASMQAIEHAKLKIDDSNKYEIGILIGSGVGGLSSVLRQVEILNARGPLRVSPYVIPMMIADNSATWVSMLTGIMGPNLSLVSSCSTGSDAIGIAYQMIRHGQIKVMIAGGAEAAIIPITIAGFSQEGALSRNPDPYKASRPFDAKRDGFVVGEGAAVIVLESLDYAKLRGACILAEVTGYGATSDAHDLTEPLESGEAAAKALELALANIDCNSVDYINAHGTSTPLNDVVETKVIKKVFGRKAYEIPISSTKSMVGHLLGAAPALEAIVCCKVISEGVIPPTINLENPDPECDLDYVPNEARLCKVNIAVSNSFGFGGHNSVLVFSKYREY